MLMAAENILLNSQRHKDIQCHTLMYTHIRTFFFSGNPVTSDVMCISHEQYQAHHITALNGNKEIRNDIVL